jgi:hypothetical protein
MARRVFSEAALPRAERDTRAIARWLIRQNPVPDIVNARDLRRMAYGPGIRDADQMNAALEEFGGCRLGWARTWASRGIWPPAARLGGEPRAGDWSLLGTVCSAEATMGPAPHGEGSRVKASAGPSAAAYSRPTEFPRMMEVRRTSRNDRATGHRVPKTPPIRTRGPCTRQPMSIPLTS